MFSSNRDHHQQPVPQPHSLEANSHYSQLNATSVRMGLRHVCLIVIGHLWASLSMTFIWMIFPPIGSQFAFQQMSLVLLTLEALLYSALDHFPAYSTVPAIAKQSQLRCIWIHDHQSFHTFRLKATLSCHNRSLILHGQIRYRTSLAHTFRRAETWLDLIWEKNTML